MNKFLAGCVLSATAAVGIAASARQASAYQVTQYCAIENARIVVAPSRKAKVIAMAQTNTCGEALRTFGAPMAKNGYVRLAGIGATRWVSARSVVMSVPQPTTQPVAIAVPTAAPTTTAQPVATLPPPIFVVAGTVAPMPAATVPQATQPAVQTVSCVTKSMGPSGMSSGSPIQVTLGAGQTCASQGYYESGTYIAQPLASAQSTPTTTRKSDSEACQAATRAYRAAEIAVTGTSRQYFDALSAGRDSSIVSVYKRLYESAQDTLSKRSYQQTDSCY